MTDAEYFFDVNVDIKLRALDGGQWRASIASAEGQAATPAEALRALRVAILVDNEKTALGDLEAAQRVYEEAKAASRSVQ